MTDAPTKEQLTAAFAAGRPTASAQDFSFGTSLFDSLAGNSGGASVAGVSSSVTDVSIEERSSGGRGKDKKEEWDRLRDHVEHVHELRERMNENLNSMYGFEFDDASFDEAIEEKIGDRAKFNAFADRNGIRGADRDRYFELSVLMRQTDDPALRAQYLAEMGRINEPGTRELAQSAEIITQAKLDQHSQNDLTSVRAIETGEIGIGVAITGASDTMTADAIAARVDDDSFAEAIDAQGFSSDEDHNHLSDRRSLESGASLFQDDRQVISGKFAEASTGQPIERPTTDAPASPKAEFIPSGLSV